MKKILFTSEVSASPADFSKNSVAWSLMKWTTGVMKTCRCLSSAMFRFCSCLYRLQELVACGASLVICLNTQVAGPIGLKVCNQSFMSTGVVFQSGWYDIIYVTRRMYICLWFWSLQVFWFVGQSNDGFSDWFSIYSIASGRIINAATLSDKYPYVSIHESLSSSLLALRPFSQVEYYVSDWQLKCNNSRRWN